MSIRGGRRAVAVNPPSLEAGRHAHCACGAHRTRGRSRSRCGIAARSARGSRVHVAEREAETIRREAQIEARELAVKLRADDRDGGAGTAHRGRQGRGAAHAGRARGRAEDDELERREQGLADRETHVKQLQEELKTTKDEALDAARARRRADGRGGEAPSARALAGPDPARARAQRPPAGGGGADGVEAPRARRWSRTRSSASPRATPPRRRSPSSSSRPTT